MPVKRGFGAFMTAHSGGVSPCAPTGRGRDRRRRDSTDGSGRYVLRQAMNRARVRTGRSLHAYIRNRSGETCTWAAAKRAEADHDRGRVWLGRCGSGIARSREGRKRGSWIFPINHGGPAPRLDVLARDRRFGQRFGDFFERPAHRRLQILERRVEYVIF